ncbi:MAG: hypothetical protein ACFHHU_01615 [Porticoccaceae bacterium]
MSHTQSIQPVSKRRPKVSEQTEPEAKPGGPAPKRSRTTKTPHTPAQDVFNLESRGNELVGGASQPNIELEGGEADPKGDMEKKPAAGAAEAPPEGGAAHAKDFDCSSSHGSEASTQLPESCVSEATTLGEHAVNILNTEVAL